MTANALELRHVTKRFGTVVAVDDVSLEIGQNEFFSLLGPSGCGKTTTLRIIGGFEEPSEGELYMNGRLANREPPNRRNTNTVFQRLALFPHMDVFDNVAYGLRMKRMGRAAINDRVRRALELVKLSELPHRRISQLSGGQMQRVAIARALVNDPAVLLLDEPLGALDLQLRQQMQLELKELQNRVGTTFIYVTHDQSEALTMSDRLAVMRDGRIEQVGTCEEVYEKPRTRFVASFIGESNLLDGTVKAVDREAAVVSYQGVRMLAPPRSDLRAGQPVTISVRPERVRLGAAAAGLDNTLRGTIQKVTYKGNLIDYHLCLESGVQLLGQLQAGHGEACVVGAETMIGWAKESCVLLEAR